MKKLWTVLIMLCFLAMLPLQGLGASAAAPKISVKTYKTEQIQYAVIHGDKYKAVNAKMKKEAEEAYATQKKLDKQMKKDKEAGVILQGTDYVIGLTPVIKYKTSTNISILTQTYIYDGGAHGNSYYESYNVYKGKLISLKKAFKSDSAYVNGKKYAKQKMLHNPASYPFADNKSTIAGHAFYFTSTGGIKVVFDPYEVAPYVDGMKTILIPKKYIK